MRSLFSHKVWIILLAVLALGALLELSIGMKSISFHEGQVFARDEPEVKAVNPAALIQGILSIPLQTHLLFWGTIGLMGFLIGLLLLSPEGRKRLLRFLFRAAFTYWALYTLLKRYPNLLKNLRLGQAATDGQTTQTSNGLPLPAFTPPQPTSWVTYALSLAIAAALILIFWRVYRVWRELSAPARGSSMKQLAGIARSSLRDLNSGGESSDVILNCYYRMGAVVAEKKRLDRRPFITPSEFATRLEQAGLPADAVQRLTRLFEAVRYGGRRTSPQMINEAVGCLTAILDYCGEAV